MFVGREEQLAKLTRFLERESPGVAVVYGRRRIGKTALIRQAAAGRCTYYFEGLENQRKSEQIRNFRLQLSIQTGSGDTGGRIDTWREAFLKLLPVLSERPGCVVLDEFQWMANYRTAIVADLKMVWDQYFSHLPGVSLILAGSIASFMTRKVVKSRALYGRTDLVIHLHGFKLPESRLLLPELGLDELLDAQMLFGGVPKYLDLLRGYPSVQLAVDELAFQADGYFVDEYDRIFVSHFGRNPDYARIVDALAAHPYGIRRQQMAALADVAHGGRLTEHLENLESAGFIQSVRPVDKGLNSRLINYLLSDAYLRFFTAFVRPQRRAIAAGRRGLFAALSQTARFHGWRGRAFEYVCLDHALRIATLLGFPGIDFSFGPYFRAGSKAATGLQIDLLYDRADRVLTLCEMKCSGQPVDRSVEQEVARKVQLLEQAYPRRTVQRVLVVHGEVSRDLERSGFFYRILRSEQLVQD